MFRWSSLVLLLIVAGNVYAKQAVSNLKPYNVADSPATSADYLYAYLAVPKDFFSKDNGYKYGESELIRFFVPFKGIWCDVGLKGLWSDVGFTLTDFSVGYRYSLKDSYLTQRYFLGIYGRVNLHSSHAALASGSLGVECGGSEWGQLTVHGCLVEKPDRNDQKQLAGITRLDNWSVGVKWLSVPLYHTLQGSVVGAFSQVCNRKGETFSNDTVWSLGFGAQLALLKFIHVDIKYVFDKYHNYPNGLNVAVKIGGMHSYYSGNRFQGRMQRSAEFYVPVYEKVELKENTNSASPPGRPVVVDEKGDNPSEGYPFNFGDQVREDSAAHSGFDRTSAESRKSRTEGRSSRHRRTTTSGAPSGAAGGIPSERTFTIRSSSIRRGGGHSRGNSSYLEDYEPRESKESESREYDELKERLKERLNPQHTGCSAGTNRVPGHDRQEGRHRHRSVPTAGDYHNGSSDCRRAKSAGVSKEGKKTYYPTTSPGGVYDEHLKFHWGRSSTHGEAHEWTTGTASASSHKEHTHSFEEDGEHYRFWRGEQENEREKRSSFRSGNRFSRSYAADQGAEGKQPKEERRRSADFSNPSGHGYSESAGDGGTCSQDDSSHSLLDTIDERIKQAQEKAGGESQGRTEQSQVPVSKDEIERLKKDFIKLILAHNGKILPINTTQELSRCYRKNALYFHPDKENGSDEAFKILNKYNDVLSCLLSMEK